MVVAKCRPSRMGTCPYCSVAIDVKRDTVFAPTQQKLFHSMDTLASWIHEWARINENIAGTKIGLILMIFEFSINHNKNLPHIPPPNAHILYSFIRVVNTAFVQVFALSIHPDSSRCVWITYLYIYTNNFQTEWQTLSKIPLHICIISSEKNPVFRAFHTVSRCCG